MPTIEYADANGMKIAYERFGDPSGTPLLLIMGLGAQMLGWPDEFCEMLAERGFDVTRYDNRDVGLSTHLHDAPQPDIVGAMAGDFSTATYSLQDMAADAAGLLDVLGIQRAHIVGGSMGGMIAQEFAIAYPDRTLSLTSIFSSTGDRNVGQASAEAMGALMAPPPQDREGVIDHLLKAGEVIGSPGFPRDVAALRERIGTAYDRAFDPVGTTRQLLAIMSAPDRTDKLRRLAVPALVIHGESDPLVDVSGGRATAEAIPGAELITIAGMGHDLPQGVWQTVVDAIAKLGS
jgi:pimeloyl-ACP methyl ester carboxylesterase